MNFLPARLLPGARAGAEAVAGVRPESVTLAPPDAAGSLAATVETVEVLGHETLVHLQLAGEDGAPVRWVTREPGMTERQPGERVSLRVAPGAIHLFGRDGRALS
jgi:ABC-type sugar transport system ATPase subunit